MDDFLLDHGWVWMLGFGAVAWLIAAVVAVMSGSTIVIAGGLVAGCGLFGFGAAFKPEQDDPRDVAAFKALARNRRR